MAKPHAKVVQEVCSLCGLDWKRHGAEPTSEKCIALLLDEVRSLNAQLAVRPLTFPLPYGYPRPVPWNPYPYRPYYWSNTSGLQANQAVGGNLPALNAQPRAVLAQ